MSLARLFPSLSLTLIRKLGDAGGPRADQVSSELDNIIAWAKQSPRVIKVDTSTVNSSGAGPDTLHTFSLPAGSLATNGDFLEVEYGFIFATAHSKIVGATFGGTEYARRGLGAQDLQGTPGGSIRSTIVRLSSTSVHVSSILLANVIIGSSAGTPIMTTSNNGGIIVGSNTPITGLSDLSANATTMTGQSLGVAASDVSQRLSVIKLYQQ